MFFKVFGSFAGIENRAKSLRKIKELRHQIFRKGIIFDWSEKDAFNLDPQLQLKFEYIKDGRDVPKNSGLNKRCAHGPT